MGASTAMYSVFQQLVLHPLPYPDPGSLVWLAPASLRTGAVRVAGNGGFSPPDFADYRSQTRSLAALGGYYPNVATLVGRGAPEHVAYTNVTGGFFQVLGVQPELGRLIVQGDETPALPQVAVLSDSLWRQRYGADPHVLGQTLDLDNRLFTIVGVMPPGFDYPRGTEMWAPESLTNPLSKFRNSRFLNVIGRLRPGADLGAAQRELRAVAQRLETAYPRTNRDEGVAVRTLSEKITGPYAASLWLMMLAAVLVLGIACANVGNLLLAGAAARWPEMAVRTALGASRQRLLGQLLAEGFWLGAVGGVAGWLAALAVLPWLRQLRPPGMPALSGVRLDGGVALAAVAAALATALWFGLTPAWELLRSGGTSLQRAANQPGSRGGSRLQAVVVAAEVATTVMLLVGAGMLLQGLSQLERVDLGFQPAHVLTFRTSLLYNDMKELQAGTPFFQQLDAKLQQTPGVAAAGMISELPLSGDARSPLHFYIPSSDKGAAVSENERLQAGFSRVMPGYFQAMGIPLEGRDVTLGDVTGKDRVVIVSRSLENALYPGQSALGREILWGSTAGIRARIVGVAGDVRQDSLAGVPGWSIYAPYAQSPNGDLSAAVLTRGDPWSYLPGIEREIQALNPQIAVYDTATLDQDVTLASAPERFRGRLILAMALLALLLALAGIYSVLAHSVAQRQRELGVRMALGANPRQVQALVLGRSLRLLLGGLVVGLAGSFAAARWLGHSVTALATGGATWLWVPLLVLAAGLAASYGPARTATRVDPVRTLREP